MWTRYQAQRLQLKLAPLTSTVLVWLKYFPVYEIEFTVSVIFAHCDSEASNDEIEAVKLSDGDEPEDEESEEEHLMLRGRLPHSALHRPTAAASDIDRDSPTWAWYCTVLASGAKAIATFLPLKWEVVSAVAANNHNAFCIKQYYNIYVWHHVFNLLSPLRPVKQQGYTAILWCKPCISNL